MKITKRQLKRIIRGIIIETSGAEFGGGAHANKENTMLQDERWQQWGGWPEGEDKVPVTKQLRDYLGDMGLMKRS